MMKLLRKFDRRHAMRYDVVAGWSSLVARWAHNPKVEGSNPSPATNTPQGLRVSSQISKTTLDHLNEWVGLFPCQAPFSREPSEPSEPRFCGLASCCRSSPCRTHSSWSDCWHGASVPAELLPERPSDPTMSGSYGETFSTQPRFGSSQPSRLAGNTSSEFLKETVYRALLTQKLVKRLKLQHAEMNRTILALEGLPAKDRDRPKTRGRPSK